MSITYRIGNVNSIFYDVIGTWKYSMGLSVKLFRDFNYNFSLKIAPDKKTKETAEINQKQCELIL